MQLVIAIALTVCHGLWVGGLYPARPGTADVASLTASMQQSHVITCQLRPTFAMQYSFFKLEHQACNRSEMHLVTAIALTVCHGLWVERPIKFGEIACPKAALHSFPHERKRLVHGLGVIPRHGLLRVLHLGLEWKTANPRPRLTLGFRMAYMQP